MAECGRLMDSRAFSTVLTQSSQKHTHRNTLVSEHAKLSVLSPHLSSFFSFSLLLLSSFPQSTVSLLLSHPFPSFLPSFSCPFDGALNWSVQHTHTHTQTPLGRTDVCRSTTPPTFCSVHTALLSDIAGEPMTSSLVASKSFRFFLTSQHFHLHHQLRLHHSLSPRARLSSRREKLLAVMDLSARTGPCASICISTLLLPLLLIHRGFVAREIAVKTLKHWRSKAEARLFNIQSSFLICLSLTFCPAVLALSTWGSHRKRKL